MIDDREQERSAILALRRGDVRGLEALVRMYQLRAVRVAYGVVGERQVAEDAAADAFLLVYERIGQFDKRRPFGPWFYRIVVNCALKAVRGRTVDGGRWTVELEGVGDWVDERVSEAPGPEEAAEQGELRELLLGLVYDLPAQQRAAVVLKYYLDMDEATIAEMLGCPLGTVKWRLYAAKGKLRERLVSRSQMGKLDVIV
ncbi:MAG: sigma-70 family RNA polymerase sigma factor [Chloroflexia bacterium]